MSAPLAVYVHLPWYVRKCPYCDFNSHVAPGTIPENTNIRALLADLECDLDVFDFGIARAAKTTGPAVDTHQTVFDAGTLGALTYAYATPEMFDGLDSDQRDDLYALGIVAYELLTGKHPYNRSRRRRHATSR